MVISNIVRENIEVTDENRELYYLQGHIANVSNFICTYLDVHEFSQAAKDEIVGIIDGNESFDDSSDVHESVIFYSTRFLMEVFSREKELIRG